LINSSRADKGCGQQCDPSDQQGKNDIFQRFQLSCICVVGW
jgi:hypothetical protein